MHPSQRSRAATRRPPIRTVLPGLALLLAVVTGCQRGEGVAPSDGSTAPPSVAVPAPVPVAPSVEVAPEVPGAPYTFRALQHLVAGIGHMPVRSPAPVDADALRDWQPSARAYLVRTLGVVHPDYDPATADVRVLGSTQLDGFRRDEITWFQEPGLRSRAFLYLPDAPGPHPGVLFWHGHSFGGHRASAGLDEWGPDDPHHAGAEALARQGWTVLAPAIRTFEPGAGARDHVHFATVARMSGRSALGIFVGDSLRALDVLVNVEGVDPDRIGVTGLSLGGFLTLLTAALDDRVSVAVVEGFLARYRGSMLREFECPCQQAGALGIDFDIADVAAMAAPTPIRFVAGRADTDIAFAEQQAAFAELEPTWGRLGRSDAVSFVAHDGGHEWIAAPAVDWFSTWFGSDGQP